MDEDTSINKRVKELEAAMDTLCVHIKKFMDLNGHAMESIGRRLEKLEKGQETMDDDLADLIMEVKDIKEPCK